MTLGAIVAHMQAGEPARTRSLTVAGVDVLKAAASGTGKYGVPIDAITVDEAAPGSVSSMSFMVEDPLREVSISIGDPVLYWDISRDVPIFLGFADTPVYTPAFGNGRTILVRCVGIEAVLDWLLLPACTLTFPFGATYASEPAVQSLCAQSIGIGVPLNWAYDAANFYGSRDQPLGQLLDFQGLMGTYTVAAGTSLRSAIGGLITACVRSRTYASTGPPGYAMTVDARGGLRLWETWGNLSSSRPSDYSDLTVTDDTAPASTPAEGLSHLIDGGSVIRGVYVIGGNAAGTGMVPDGSGIPGRTTTISDSSILTAEARITAATAVMNASAAAPRGSFDIRAAGPVAGVRPGSAVTLTDTGVGSSTWYRVTGISKTFHPGGTETWRVSYGSPEPSYVDAKR